jgi:serine protease Do
METTLDFVALADSVRRITVEVIGNDAALGSGVSWPRGHVITNAHVVRRARVAVRSVDGRHLPARLLVRDADADLALLRLEGADLPTATLGDVSRMRVGSLVVAVGHPFGVRGALSAGIVHVIAPIVRGGAPWIHADVRLAPGNSGGPLADVSGAIVGVNAMIVGGLALAVPIARVIGFARSAGVGVT